MEWIVRAAVPGAAWVGRTRTRSMEVIDDAIHVGAGGPAAGGVGQRGPLRARAAGAWHCNALLRRPATIAAGVEDARRGVPAMAMDVVDYEIKGSEMQFVEVELDPGEAAVGAERIP